MGLQHAVSKLRSGYVEGYGTSANMNCPSDCDHLLQLPLKFIFKLTCEEVWRVCEPLVYEQIHQHMDMQDGRNGLCATRAAWFPCLSTCFRFTFEVPFITVCSFPSSWPAHRDHREIYGESIPHRQLFWNMSPARLARFSCSRVTLMNSSFGCIISATLLEVFSLFTLV